jgi:hypothetical protein
MNICELLTNHPSQPLPGAWTWDIGGDRIMSSVSSIGSSSYAQRPQSIGGQRNGGPAQQLERDLTSFLEAAGIGADEQKAIKSEIKKAIASTISGTGRPDPSAVKKIVQSVLEEHDLKGEDFTNALPTPATFSLLGTSTQPPGGQGGPPPGPPPGGPPPGPPPASATGSRSGSSATSSSEETTKESFIEKLLALLKSQSNSSSKSSSKAAAATYSTNELDLYA